MNRERIEELMLKRAHTVAEKAEIRQAADEAGMEYVIKERCRPCYDKLLQRLYDLDPAERNVSPDGWRLRNPRESFVLMGVLYSNGTIARQCVGTMHPSVRDVYFERAGAPDIENLLGDEGRD